MPLTAKGNEIKAAMQQEYGTKKGEQILYASKNAGTISGIDDINALRDSVPAIDPKRVAPRSALVIEDHK